VYEFYSPVFNFEDVIKILRIYLDVTQIYIQFKNTSKILQFRAISSKNFEMFLLIQSI
jgi:hypothetical protein